MTTASVRTIRPVSRSTSILAGIARFGVGGLLIASVIARVFFPEAIASINVFPAPAQAFLEALQQNPYFNPLLYGTEFLVGVALLSGRFIPLALLVFAGININIALFHLVLAPSPLRLVEVTFLLAAHLYLAWLHWDRFVPLFTTPALARMDRGLVVLLGVLFTLPGLAKLFLPFANISVNYGAGLGFMTGLQYTGYAFMLLAITELICGLMLLANRAVPLALTMLGAVVVNSVAFHVFLNNHVPGLIVTTVLVVLVARIAWSTRSAYTALLRP